MSSRTPDGMIELEQKVLNFVVSQCNQEPKILRATLFGSRARRDHHERSDFDLAIEAPEIADDAWARFALRLREEAPTLCGIDIVRIKNKTSKDLLEKIKQEGIEIYAR